MLSAKCDFAGSGKLNEELHYGGLRLVWISYLRLDLNAGAPALRRALEWHFVQSASSHRPPSGEAAAHLPARQSGARPQRNRQRLRVSQKRIRDHRARGDQEDRAADREDNGDSRIREIKRRRSSVFRILLLHGSRGSWPASLCPFDQGPRRKRICC